MNCHRARQLISPFLDQRLTGREMLALEQHFSECASCEAERHSIRQVKLLLRSLHQPRPRPDLPGAISVRLAEAEQPLWRVLSLAAVTPVRPQRGRRLVTALALSCLTVLSFAATCFAPASRSGALTSSGFLFPMDSPPATLAGTGPALLSEGPRPDFLSLAEADARRRERLFLSQGAGAASPEMRLAPLSYGAPPGYAQGVSTFAAYRTR